MLKKLLAKLAVKPKPKKRPRKKPAAVKKSLSKKKSPAGKPKKPAEKEMGRVVAFFRIPVVAVIRVTKGTLKTGERVWIKGHTTDLKLAVNSMQMNHQPISVAKKGEEVGVQLPSRARRGDRVYRLPA